MALNKVRLAALLGLVVVVLTVGCSGALPGTGDDIATPAPSETPSATPTATPTVTPTPMPTPTSTATPTPVPDHLNYDRFGREIAEGLNNYRGEQWAEGFGDHEIGAVGVAITKPEGWTVQDAEMEGAREVARMSALVAFDDREEARETGGFVRPDHFQVLVVNQDGTRLSRTFIDAGKAAKYADGNVSLEEYAQHVASAREVRPGTKKGETVSEREPKLALRAAEYRPFQQIHLHRIATSNPLNSSAQSPQIERAVILPKKETVYYEYSPGPEENEVAQAARVTRTYLETIKKMSERRRVNRIPSQMVLYTDVSWSREETSMLTTAKTEWAMEYFTLSDWTLPQNKTLTHRELDAYINRIDQNQKFIEDDQNYDPLNETVRNSGD